jgi:hypothetical protein
MLCGQRRPSSRQGDEKVTTTWMQDGSFDIDGMDHWLPKVLPPPTNRLPPHDVYPTLMAHHTERLTTPIYTCRISDFATTSTSYSTHIYLNLTPHLMIAAFSFLHIAFSISFTRCSGTSAIDRHICFLKSFRYPWFIVCMPCYTKESI